MPTVIEDFDRAFPTDPGWPAPPRPTEESLAGVIEALGLPGLPTLFVRLARQAEHFGVWFGGLGPDYDDRRNTVRINTRWREEGLPSSLFLMTYGFDSICDCLDLTSSDDPDTMRVVQVEVGLGDLESRVDFAPTFEAYLERIIEIFSRREGA